jgi:hypothetical protein
LFEDEQQKLFKVLRDVVLLEHLVDTSKSRDGTIVLKMNETEDWFEQ